MHGCSSHVNVILSLRRIRWPKVIGPELRILQSFLPQDDS
jgi:hypothetical protein